ncbi:MAG: mercury methylation ferredoxin HgcB [Thermoleophilia bacterium]
MRYLADVTTLEYDVEKCTGCGRCVEVCPHGVFVIEDKRARVTDRDRCMECGACALNCEYGALAVDAGVGCAAAIIKGLITGSEPSCGCDNDEGPASCC